MLVAKNTQGQRVAITGVGVVSCVGIGKDIFWSGLFKNAPEGERRVPGFDGTNYFGEKDVRRIDLFTQYTVAAAEEAIDQAGGVDALNSDPERVGSIIGTGIGGIGTLEEQITLHGERGPRRVSPFLVPMMMGNAAAANVSMRFGFQGPAECVSTACATGPHALGAGARLIASGRCDVVIAGSSEASMTPTAIAGFRNMTALSDTNQSMPFSEDRNGFVIAEGCGILVLESEERAKARGASILGYLDGAASNADAHHITAPAPGGRGAIACMKLALADAGLTPSDIKQINAHGTSTGLNDAAEAHAVVDVFGLPTPPMTSIKGVTGHSLGAAGSLEAIACVQSILTKRIPPTMGTTKVDPALPEIDLVLDQDGREWTPGPIISNSFGFGGHNGSIIISPA